MQVSFAWGVSGVLSDYPNNPNGLENAASLNDQIWKTINAIFLESPSSSSSSPPICSWHRAQISIGLYAQHAWNAYFELTITL